MTFLTLIAILGGLVLLFSAIENQSILAYLQSWTGTQSNATN